jgi:hypothetical protein
MLPEILGQTLGIIATLITALSYQANTKKKLLFIQSVATLCTCISYLLLGATSGFALNIVCLIRNVCFYFQKEGKTPFYISTSIFVVMMGILGAMSWQGPISLLIIVALAANTVFLSFGNPQLLRKSILGTSSLVLTYNIFVFSLGGIANEALAFLSSVVGILRFRQEEKSA